MELRWMACAAMALGLACAGGDAGGDDGGPALDADGSGGSGSGSQMELPDPFASGGTTYGAGTGTGTGTGTGGSDTGGTGTGTGTDTGTGGALGECVDDDAPLSAVSLLQQVVVLASDDMEGRGAGTAGDRAARKLIEHHFECLGLTPAGEFDGEYQHEFTDNKGNETANVLAVVEGSDPTVADEVIVLSAHHDGLGIKNGKIRNGANDNASGTAALMGIASVLAKLPEAPRRTIVLAAFGSEEVNLDGSYHYTEHPPDDYPVEDVVYVVNLDMIGTFEHNEGVWVYGSFDGTPGRDIVESLVPAQLLGDFFTLGEGAAADSDYAAFCDWGIPYVYFETFDVECYHEACDDAGRLDAENLAMLTQLGYDVLLELANTDLDLPAIRDEIGCPY